MIANRHLLICAMCTSCLLVSCASIHNGEFATQAESNSLNTDKSKPLESGLRVSGSEIESLSSTYFAAIDLTFENTTNDWLNIDDVKLSFGNETTDKQVSYPVGNELSTWAASAQQRAAIDEYNTRQVLSALAVAGAGLAAVSSRSGGQALGLASATGALSVSAANSMTSDIQNLEVSKLVPSTHLLAPGFMVPPGLHTKKWVLINCKNPVEVPLLTDLYITVTIENKPEKMKLSFRKVNSGLNRTRFLTSEFQKDHPMVKVLPEKQNNKLITH